MDAVEFIREWQRMCNAYKGACIGCPMEGEPCGGYRDVDAERLVGAVEAWPAAHPRKTRQSVFLEQWPEAQIDDNGAIYVCPNEVSTAYRDAYGGCAKTNISCPDCHREFWMREVK